MTEIYAPSKDVLSDALGWEHEEHRARRLVDEVGPLGETRRFLTGPVNCEITGAAFTPDALKAIAKRAETKGTGARGLRSVIEMAMLDLMYEIPSREDVVECVVNEEVIEQGAEPLLVYKREAESA